MVWCGVWCGVVCGLWCVVCGEMSYLLDQTMVRGVPAELHVRSVTSGLQPGLSHLQRSLLVPQPFLESLDVFLLVVDLLHRLGEVRLQLVVGVCRLLKHTESARQSVSEMMTNQSAPLSLVEFRRDSALIG